MSDSRLHIFPLAACALFPGLLLLLSGCSDDAAAGYAAATAQSHNDPYGAAHNVATAEPEQTNVIADDQPQIQPLPPAKPRQPSQDTVNPQFSVDQNQFLFDVSSHSQEELLALLKRADEIATVASPDLENLDIALILHGADIGWFSKQNYEANKELVDLAARLDALQVIDLKICQQAMLHHGYIEDDIPAFIDRVPYGPDEMQRLQGSGYFTL